MNVQRFKRAWEALCDEPLKVEQLSGAIYAYGSELACLRLFYKYNKDGHNPRTRADYSANRKTWFFRMEVN